MQASTDSTLLCRLDHAGLFLPGGFERRLILQDICWDVHAGEHTVLIGKNGAGKTTLMRLMHGEAWCTQGSCSWYDGENMCSSRITGLGVTSMVSPVQQEDFQRHAWAISGAELMLSGFDGTPMLYSEPDAARCRLVEEVADELDCRSLLARGVRTLSQGQMRLLLLGRAMVRRPRLLLLDECTDGLDARHRDLFMAALKRLSKVSTIIMTTHRESMLPDWVERRRYIHEGRLLDVAPAELAAEAVAAPEREHMVSGSTITNEALVEVVSANVYISGRIILHDINWTMNRGEHWMLEGGNGSGKSTFLRMLAGDEQVAWPGRITVHLPRDEDIPFAMLRRRVRLVSDMNQALYEYDVTCLELVLSGIDNTVGLYRSFSEVETQTALRQLERVNLAGLADTSIRRISTGQLRRAFLARALMGLPLVLLLDEACTGLDERGRHEYLDVLDRLADEGLSYVFVSHYQEDAPLTINRRARMREGRLELLG